jgi:hypothetical protein
MTVLFMPAAAGVTVKAMLPVLPPPDPQPEALARKTEITRQVKAFLNRMFPPHEVLVNFQIVIEC